ncbi:MAG: TonB-dependent receptor [Flammeovirgaceae bacterium]
MQKYLLLFCLLFSLAPFCVSSQTTCKEWVRGRVWDEADTPLYNAFVSVDGVGTVSQPDGTFAVEVPCAKVHQVTVQFLGYRAFNERFAADRALDIHLQPDQQELNEVVIETVAERTETAQNFSVVNEKMLEANAGKTLGETLKEVPGVSAIQAGPGIFKPVIHGVHSQRVLILNHGIRQEGQQWGAEHAPEIDPFIASNIVVVKDASAIKYGTDALGGVIIVNPPNLPVTNKLGGAFQTIAQSNGRMGTVSGMLEGGLKNLAGFGWRVQGTAKRAGDFHTSTYQLTNTGLSETDFSAAAGYQNDKLKLEVFFSHFQTEIGILRGAAVGNINDLLVALEREPPQGTLPFSYSIAEPRQVVQHNLLKLSGELKSNNAVWRLNYGLQSNARQEFDQRIGGLSKLPVIDLALTTHTLDVERERISQGNTLHTTLGASIMAQNNNNIPGTQRIPFIPNYDNLSGGAYGILKKEWSKLTLNGGIRYDYRSYSVAGFDFKNELYTSSLLFHNVSATLGGTYTLSNGKCFSSSLSSAWRPPHVAELYSLGTHQSAASIEYGLLLNEQTNEVMDIKNSNFKNEQALKWVSMYRVKRGKLLWEATGYINYIFNYIYLRPTGVTQTIRGVYPYFRYTQTNASFVGGDLMLEWRPNPHMMVAPRASILHATDETNKDYLFFIPPNRYEVILRWEALERLKLKGFFAEAKITFNDQQHRAPRTVTVREINEANEKGIDLFASDRRNFDFMDAPAAYWLVNLSTGFNVRAQKVKYDFRLSADNLFNTTYRSYTNRLRYFANELGTNLSILIKCTF